MCTRGCGQTTTQVENITYVKMAYLGTNGGQITFNGYLKRYYRVRKGDTPDVHPGDVEKLEKTNLFKKVEVKPAAIPAPTQPAAIPAPTYDIAPQAEALAQANGVDLSKVTGTGANGRILKRDIEAVING